MSEGQGRSPEWLDRARSDPGAVFAEPEDVLECAELSNEDRIQILRSWEYDAAELEVSTEEGMDGPKNGLLQRVLDALATLTDGHDAEHVGPTKQHGLIDSAD